MAGIYQRDNLAQILGAELESAFNRRQAYLDREAQRRNQNAQFIGQGLKSVGRSLDMYINDDERLLKELLERRQELLKKSMEGYRPYESTMGSAPARTYTVPYAAQMGGDKTGVI
jgi:hypothetical protein